MKSQSARAEPLSGLRAAAPHARADSLNRLAPNPCRDLRKVQAFLDAFTVSQSARAEPLSGQICRDPEQDFGPGLNRLAPNPCRDARRDALG